MKFSELITKLHSASQPHMLMYIDIRSDCELVDVNILASGQSDVQAGTLYFADAGQLTPDTVLPTNLLYYGTLPLDEYPLVMTSGARFWGMFHSEHRQIERMRHYRPWPLMEIHPDTAAKYGIKDGDWVWMEGPLGRAKRKAKLTPIMDRRLVSCDHGWWFPEGDPEKFYLSLIHI